MRDTSSWNWSCISTYIHISEVRKNPDLPWDKNFLSYNSSLDIRDVMHLDLPKAVNKWNWTILSDRVRTSLMGKYPELGDHKFMISLTKTFNPEDICMTLRERPQNGKCPVEIPFTYKDLKGIKLFPMHRRTYFSNSQKKRSMANTIRKLETEGFEAVMKSGTWKTDHQEWAPITSHELITKDIVMKYPSFPWMKECLSGKEWMDMEVLDTLSKYPDVLYPVTGYNLGPVQIKGIISEWNMDDLASRVSVYDLISHGGIIDRVVLSSYKYLTVNLILYYDNKVPIPKFPEISYTDMEIITLA